MCHPGIFFQYITVLPLCKDKNLPDVNFFSLGILRTKGGRNMNAKGWAITAGLGAAAGAVAVLMMPKSNPTRRLAAKAANKMEDVAWKVSDSISSKMDSMDM